MLKILKIPGDQCIEGYPDRLMPTLLIYGPNGFRSQTVGLAELGGNNTKVQGMQLQSKKDILMLDLERYAQMIGALSEAEIRVRKNKDEDAEESMQTRKSIRDDDDDDDDWD